MFKFSVHTTAHSAIGTGRLCARRRFGYWGEQIGHLRDQSGQFDTLRRNLARLPRHNPRQGADLWRIKPLQIDPLGVQRPRALPRENLSS